MIDLTSLRPRKVELPLVSVIVPYYNVEQYIDQCLNSILDNGYPNVEVICVDDHSTDKTVEHIQNLMKSHSNIQLYDNGADHNIYGGACRNIGMEHAKGKYIYFCDSDDYIFPGLFRTCVERCESLNADICCFKFKTRLDGRSFGPDFNAIHDKGAATFDYSGVENLYWFAGPQTWNKFYNREFVESIHARYQPLKNSNDQFFGIMCMSSAKRITALDKTFYFHRMNTKTSVQRDKQKGNNLGDIVSAIRAAHEYVSALPNAKGIRRHFDRYVQCELRYMNNNGFTITHKFIDDMRMCLKEIGCADDDLVKMVMGQLESKAEQTRHVGNEKPSATFNIRPEIRPMLFATVNAGTNTFTNITAKSILKFHPSAKVIVVDVVPERRFHWIDGDVPGNVEVVKGIYKSDLNLPAIDVSRTNLSQVEKDMVRQRMNGDNIVRVSGSGDTQHSMNIQMLLDTLDENFVLIDSDAPLTHPVNFIDASQVTVGSLATQPYNSTRRILGQSSRRFEPFIQYFNVDKVKNNGLWFFRPDRLKDCLRLAYKWKPNLSAGDEPTATSEWSLIWLTGTIFCDQVMAKGLPYGTIDNRRYVDHFGSGTWNHTKDGSLKNSFYEKYSGLFQNKHFLDYSK